MGLGGLGRCLRPQCFLEVATTTSQGWDGGAVCVLQHGSQGFTGLFGLGWASLGLVCSDSSVRSMTAVRRWRWVPQARLKCCCSVSGRCRVPPSYRSRASGLEETVMGTIRPWWRVLVGGEVWWWCSVAPRFFVGGGREKSLSACLTLTRCRFQVAPFLLEGRCGKPPSTLLRTGENPTTI
jgi:hypothetical protein